MGRVQPDPEVALLLRILDEAYEKRAWHGPNLKGSVRGLSAAQADWRPRPDRHSIADIVVHAAYWKYAVRRRLRGDRRGSFPLKGSNWFALPMPLTEEAWQQYRGLLDAEHKALRASVAGLPYAELHQTAAGSNVRNSTLIYGVAAHDVYHTGQIQLLKHLRANAP
jgi:uncharacterized damage-inducible protein DinB